MRFVGLFMAGIYRNWIMNFGLEKLAFKMREFRMSVNLFDL